MEDGKNALRAGFQILNAMGLNHTNQNCSSEPLPGSYD